MHTPEHAPEHALSDERAADRADDAGAAQGHARTGDDAMTLVDGTGRRRFLRTGGALLAAAPMLASRPGLAADCDRGGSATAEQKQQAGAGSDSDQGAGSDPIGCGRYRDEKPKISRLDPLQPPPAIDTIEG